MKIIHTPIKRIILFSLLIGIALGTIAAYFLFPRIITQNKDIVSEKVVHDTVYIEKRKIVYKTKYIERNTIDSISKDSMDTSLASQDSLMTPENDSIHNNIAQNNMEDSISNSAGSANNQLGQIEKNGQNISIAKNEILETQYIIPEGNANNFYCKSNTDLDSLLVDNYTAKAEQEGIQVEFWRSPVNTVGYQLGRRTLILYGFYEFKQIGLKYMEDGSLQMTYLKDTYNLKCGNEFKTLIINK